MRIRKIASLLLTFVLLSLSLPAFAQKQEGKKEKAESPTVTTGKVATFSGDGGIYTVTVGDGSYATVVSLYGLSVSVIKGQPFSAQAANEFTQTLADGNRIVRKSTTMLYRDIEGRTRREQTLTSVGPYAVAGEPAKTIFIYDPVAGVNYTLDERSKTVFKVFMPTTAQGKTAFADGYAAGISYSMGKGQGGGVAVATTDTAQKAEFEAKLKEKAKIKEKVSGDAVSVSGNSVVVSGGVATTTAYAGSMPKREQKEESLGKQTMEGVEVEGTRYISTIPAGEIGNELPINIITEKWYSQELKQLIYLKTSDPRHGETIYRLTNIVRSNPDPFLFEVPSDYTIKEMKPAVLTTTSVQKWQEELKKKTAKPQQ